MLIIFADINMAQNVNPVGGSVRLHDQADKDGAGR